MAVTNQSPAPYTAGAALLTVIRRFRDKGLTTPFTADVLVRAGVSESLIPRTLYAMTALELMDDKAMPTETFQKIRMVAEKDYKATVAEWLKSVYADVFSFVDPVKDDATAVRDAFRAYQPHGQQDRMVALFLSLCAEAGLVDESKKSDPKPAARKPLLPARPAVAQSRAISGGKRSAAPAVVDAGLPPALAGLMKSLPRNGWTKATRDKFLKTFESVLDFVVPIVAKEPDPEEIDIMR